MNQGSDNPGVHFPPPLLYVGAIVGGWLLDRVWPLSIGGGTGRTALGWVFVAGWALLAGSAIGLFRRKQTSMITFRPASALVSSGLYTFTRNPMYVSLALLTIAFALFLNSWWVVILLIPTLLGVRQIVIVPEEHYLRRRFGAEYRGIHAPRPSMVVRGHLHGQQVAIKNLTADRLRQLACTRKMSATTRKTVSARMKRHWAERRKSQAKVKSMFVEAKRANFKESRPVESVDARRKVGDRLTPPRCWSS